MNLSRGRFSFLRKTPDIALSVVAVIGVTRVAAIFGIDLEENLATTVGGEIVAQCITWVALAVFGANVRNILKVLDAALVILGSVILVIAVTVLAFWSLGISIFVFLLALLALGIFLFVSARRMDEAIRKQMHWWEYDDEPKSLWDVNAADETEEGPWFLPDFSGWLKANDDEHDDGARSTGG